MLELLDTLEGAEASEQFVYWLLLREHALAGLPAPAHPRDWRRVHRVAIQKTDGIMLNNILEGQALCRHSSRYLEPWMLTRHDEDVTCEACIWNLSIGAAADAGPPYGLRELYQCGCYWSIFNSSKLCDGGHWGRAHGHGAPVGRPEPMIRNPNAAQKMAYVKELRELGFNYPSLQTMLELVQEFIEWPWWFRSGGRVGYKGRKRE